MKARYRFVNLFSALCAAAVISSALCTVAIAGPSGKDVIEPLTYQAVPKQKIIMYYVKSSASAIPQPIERLGGITSTTVPMVVYGDPRISN